MVNQNGTELPDTDLVDATPTQVGASFFELLAVGDVDGDVTVILDKHKVTQDRDIATLRDDCGN